MACGICGYKNETRPNCSRRSNKVGRSPSVDGRLLRAGFTGSRTPLRLRSPLTLACRQFDSIEANLGYAPATLFGLFGAEGYSTPHNILKLAKQVRRSLDIVSVLPFLPHFGQQRRHLTVLAFDLRLHWQWQQRDFNGPDSSKTNGHRV